MREQKMRCLAQSEQDSAWLGDRRRDPLTTDEIIERGHVLFLVSDMAHDDAFIFVTSTVPRDGKVTVIMISGRSMVFRCIWPTALICALMPPV
jgi:hypothetical protein